MQLTKLVTDALNALFNLHDWAGNAVYVFYQTYSRAILDIVHEAFKGAFNVLLVTTIILAGFYLFMAIFVLFQKHNKSRALPRGNEPFVTVQIPTFNELAALNCAKRCLAFDYPKDRFEVLIGDDSSDKKVSAKISAFAAKYPGRVKVTRRGSNAGFKPGNLNYMLNYSKGEFLVLFDSDFLPDRDFLRRIIEPFRHDDNIAVVQARWRTNNFSQSLFSVLAGTISQVCHYVTLPFTSQNKGTSFLLGSAEAIRRKDLEEVGGWQSGSLTEDIECSLRLIKEGKRLVYLEDVQCGCEAPFTFKDLCKQQMRWAFGVISAVKQHFFGLFGRKVRGRDTAGVFIFASGYLFAMLLFSLTAFGFLSLISAHPAPIDWDRFLRETGRNVLLTSGYLGTCVIALILGKHLKELPRMIMASLSVGLLVTYHVNIGIAKALFNRQMPWFMLAKNGNRNVK
ncbi:MAG: glycosyltransferase family 2 protein [Nanoarchaeota archaeon]